MSIPQRLQEVSLDLLVVDPVRRPVIKAGQARDRADIGVLGVNRESTELDLVDEFLA
jgi:hypothetical protein